jgi:hypothetical protein
MEDFIFDDDADEVGAEVEAHCPKCKADTQHVVVSKYEDEIRRVQCNPCGDVHPYRKPRGESEEEEPAPAVKKKAVKAKPTWDQVMAKHAKKQPKVYQLGEFFKEMEVLSHPKFGVGFVTENIGDDKIEVTFKEDKRVLVHNRKGLSLPYMKPAATPAAAKVAKPAGKKGAAAAPAAPAPAPAVVTAAPEAAKPEKGDKGDKKAAKGKAAVVAAPAKTAAKAAPAPAAKSTKAAPAKAPAAKAPSKPATKPAPAKKPAAKAAARTAVKKPTAKPAAKKVKKGR